MNIKDKHHIYKEQNIGDNIKFLIFRLDRDHIFITIDDEPLHQDLFSRVEVFRIPDDLPTRDTAATMVKQMRDIRDFSVDYTDDEIIDLFMQFVDEAYE